MTKEFKLLDFKTYDDEFNEEPEEGDDYMTTSYKFVIQLFGLDKNRNTYCAIIDDYLPYFYVKVPQNGHLKTCDFL